MVLKLGQLLSIAIITLAVGFFVTDNAGFAQDADTVLLLHMDGSDGSTTFTDDSIQGHTATVDGNSQISTSESKFGGASGFLNGTDDTLQFPIDNDWSFGTGLFTVDFWVYRTSYNGGGGTKRLIGAFNAGFNFPDKSDWYVSVSGDDDKITFAVGDLNTDRVSMTSTTATVANTWYHIAVVREGTGTNQTKLYINGVEEAVGTFVNDIGQRYSLFVNGGILFPTELNINGYFDELRVSKGVARWTADFTPPTAPYGGGTNNPPDGNILNPTGVQNIVVGDSITFNGSGTDPDGDPMTYHWNFGVGSGISDNNTESPGSLAFNNTGQFVVTFTVTDSYGLPDPTPGTVTINVTDVPNQPPDGTIDSPVTDLTINTGDSVNFIGTGTDPDNDTPLSYSWNFGVGSGIPDDINVSPSIVFNNSGEFVVTFTVTDFKGLSDPTPDTVTITVTPSGGGGSGDGYSLDAADGNPIDAVFVDNEGNVGIGTTNPGTYKLAVNGTIKAKEVVVELTGWSDFVFKKDYPLMSLEQLEKYIENNKHLPQIPSEADVIGKGVSVGDMQSRLLQKIEELTLYMINMKKKTEEFEQENLVLRSENDLIKKRLEALEKVGM